MRAIVQRVTSAQVSVGGELVSRIGQGLCVLIGIGTDDTIEDAEYLARKILNGRWWPDESGKQWSKSCLANDFEILLVSQFTLFGFLKGNKPDYHAASENSFFLSFFQNYY